MEPTDVAARLGALDAPRGDGRRFLRIGDWRLRVEGLDGALADGLDERWGGFVVPDNGMEPLLALRVVQGDGRGFERPRRGEVYRVEVDFSGPARPLLWSYNYAARPDRDDPRAWKVALHDEGEPVTRIVENVVRYLVARTTVGMGGIALHGAGVLHEGRAHLFAGGSRAGKSTAVRLSRPRVSLGDDFALCIPSRRQWHAAAVPFDNSERAATAPPPGWYPVAGIWRLHQADSTRLETPPPPRAVASLMSCVAFPTVLGDLADSILRHVGAYVAEGRFGELHFDISAEFWNRIDRVCR